MRGSRLLSVIAVGVAAVAVVATDIAVIPHRSHEIAVRHAAEKRAAYVEHLRAPLTALYALTQPLQNANDAAGGADGSDYAARDTLAHTTAAAGLDKELIAVKAVVAPKDLTGPAKTLVDTLTKVDTDVKGLAGTAKLVDQPLADAFVTGAYSTLASDEQLLGAAIDALYDNEHRPEPPVTGPGGGAHRVSLPASHDSWLLGVDQACATGELATAALDIPDRATPAQYQAALKALTAVEATAEASIRKTAAPAGDVRVRTLVSRLSLVDKQIALFGKALASLQSGNAQAALTNVEMGQGYDADITALGDAFTAYGATVCGFFYDESDSGSGSGGGSGSGSGSGQAT